MSIIRRLCEGGRQVKDQEAFAHYLLQVGAEIERLLIAKGARKEDAEDILQNVYYKVYTLLDTLDERTLRPWLFRVALNEYIDLKRKKSETNVALSAQLEARLGQDGELEELFQRDEILFLLKNVKREYKEIFVLKYYYDFTYEEIASLLGLQVENVKQKLYRARKTIRAEARGLRKWINRLKK